MSSFIKDFISLLYPDLCLGCGSHISKSERNLCLYCQCNLPRTDFTEMPDNRTEKLLWGRINFEAATSFLYFSKKGLTQRLMHQLKYKKQGDLGVELGAYFGWDMSRSNRFDKVDMIVPVPLHKNKQQERGYNQSQKIAEGILSHLGRDLSADNLIRIKNRSSQTGKNRMDRWEGLKSDFVVRKPELFEGKNLLVVDDVITTGATLEACCILLSEIKGVKLSIATLAIPIN